MTELPPSRRDQLQSEQISPDPQVVAYTIEIIYKPQFNNWDWRVVRPGGKTAWKNWHSLAHGTTRSKEKAAKKAEKIVRKLCEQDRRDAEYARISAEKSIAYEVRCG